MRPIQYPIQYPILWLSAMAFLAYVMHRNWPFLIGVNSEWPDIIFGWFLSLFGFGILSVISLALGSGMALFVREVVAQQEWELCWKAKMVSMRNTDGVQGSIHGGIFMISGTVGMEQTYFYYTFVDEDNSFRPHKWVATERTSIFEEDRTDGEVRQWDHKLTKPWMYWLTYPDDKLVMEFHIPKGSLKQEFKVQ